MSTFNIGKCEKIKKFDKDALTVDVKDNDGNITRGVTIYSVDKDNKPFPNFGDISTGSVVEGNLYQKPGTTYWTLYPPKPKGGSGMGNGMGKALMAEKYKSIEVAQNRKVQAIDKAQDRNEVMWAKRNAAEIIAHHAAYKYLSKENLTEVWGSLVRTMYNFNPDSTLSAMDEDAINSHKELDDGLQYPTEEIDPNDIPF